MFVCGIILFLFSCCEDNTSNLQREKNNPLIKDSANPFDINQYDSFRVWSNKINNKEAEYNTCNLLELLSNDSIYRASTHKFQYFKIDNVKTLSDTNYAKIFLLDYLHLTTDFTSCSIQNGKEYMKFLNFLNGEGFKDQYTNCVSQFQKDVLNNTDFTNSNFVFLTNRLDRLNFYLLNVNFITNDSIGLRIMNPEILSIDNIYK
jgi:hypothetical protein